MKTLEIFDPAMCCSTGVCGPAVDPELARFAGDLAWLQAQGASVRRYNLAQEPLAFAQNAVVAKVLQDGGPECLPLVLVEGQVRAMGAYPSRDRLLHWAGVEAAADAQAPAGAEVCGSGPGGSGPRGGCGPRGCC